MSDICPLKRLGEMMARARTELVMNPEIRPIRSGDIERFREVLDAVAREKRFLSFLEAPPHEQMKAFVLNNIGEGFPQFVALIDDEVVGWCDILPNPRRVVQAHC